jgi:hypothetical protein
MPFFPISEIPKEGLFPVRESSPFLSAEKRLLSQEQTRAPSRMASKEKEVFSL